MIIPGTYYTKEANSGQFDADMDTHRYIFWAWLVEKHTIFFLATAQESDQ